MVCPANAHCLGDYMPLKVDSGYWRANQSSLITIECIHTSEQCLGGEICATGYTGILCEECDNSNGYSRGSVPYTCESCESNVKFLILFIISQLFSVVVVLLVVYGNISFRDEELRNFFA